MTTQENNLNYEMLIKVMIGEPKTVEEITEILEKQFNLTYSKDAISSRIRYAVKRKDIEIHSEPYKQEKNRSWSKKIKLLSFEKTRKRRKHEYEDKSDSFHVYSPLFSKKELALCNLINMFNSALKVYREIAQ
jgi:uncharacterized protein with ATP-grasp and redox domains